MLRRFHVTGGEWCILHQKYFKFSDSLNSDVRTSSDNLRSELSEGRKYETINRNSNKENKFLYKDSSAIRESAEARDEFKPIQFPTPQRNLLILFVILLDNFFYFFKNNLLNKISFTQCTNFHFLSRSA